MFLVFIYLFNFVCFMFIVSRVNVVYCIEDERVFSCF